MALTITIPGAVETTTGSTAPAVLTVGVGAPGQGVPSGGTAGMVLTKVDSTDYNTVFATPSADFITSVTAPLAVATGVLSVDLSAKANLASPSLTGTPLSTTAAVDTNTTQIATTAYVVGQAGTGTPIVDGTPAVGTSLLYSRQDHVHPTDTTRAALASPTFTGTPTLPTGSIGVTQSLGNNTTALATTAFVTAAVPAFGSTADINSPSSTTKAASIANVREMMLSPGYQLFYLGVGVSGTASSGYYNSAGGRYKQYQNSATSGSYGQFTFDTNGSSIGYAGFTRGQSANVHNWSKEIWISGRCFIGTWNSGGNGDANSIARINLGGKNAFGGGNLSSSLKGIGWNVAGGGSAVMNLQVSNGTTVTTVATSFTPTLRQAFDWTLYSDGSGNVTLYINDAQVATTSAGPTGTMAFGLYIEGVDAIGASTAFTLETFGTKIYHGT